MTSDPVELQRALDTFTDEWSPRIITRVNDYDVRLVKIRGEFVWHRHVDTDEFFHVLDGNIDLALRDAPGQQRVVHLDTGSVFTVPRGIEHKPSSADGASVLLFEPSNTVNTGDRGGELPSHIHSTTGRNITSNP